MARVVIVPDAKLLGASQVAHTEWRLTELQRALRYLAVGAFGFLIDAGILSILVHIFGVGPFIARVPSFLTAVTGTWWVNRTHTFIGFARRSVGRQYSLYLFAQVLGALTNLGIYTAAISEFEWCAKFPVSALAGAATVGLVVNYGLVRLLVFRAA